MHIAVCDDNVADRKQMERLLTRASDENKRNGIEGYFIDSYGNAENFIGKVQMYDALFLDMSESEENGLEIARHIREVGGVGKIILMISKIDFRELSDENEKNDFIFIDKPIKTAELRGILDVCEEARYNKEPMIELRTDEETKYVHGDEFLYAYSQELEKITVFLTEGREMTFRSTLQNFYGELGKFTNIVPINDTVIVNVDHIKAKKAFSAIMDDGKTFRVAFRKKGFLKK